MTRVWLDIAAGDPDEHRARQGAFDEVAAFLAQHAATYGLPDSVEALDDEGRELLRQAYSDRCPGRPFVDARPPSLTLPRVFIDLATSPGLAKTTANFEALCTGSSGSMKKAPHKKLHYEGCPIHRVESNFVVQGGDVTRGDGSGGASIYSGGTLPLEKEGLKAPFSFGSVAMASSGAGKPGTSQFFLTLTDEPRQLKKLDGKYVVFGAVAPESHPTLRTLAEEFGTPSGAIQGGYSVWIEACGSGASK